MASDAARAQAGRRILDPGLAQLYARAVLAITRARHHIQPEEGRRLVARLEARCGGPVGPVALADLLLAEPLEPGELAAELRAALPPFRGDGLHPSELAAVIVDDSIAAALAKGYVSEEEARELLRYASALGCSVDDVRAMSVHLVPFLAALEVGITPARGPGSSSRRRPRDTGR